MGCYKEKKNCDCCPNCQSTKEDCICEELEDLVVLPVLDNFRWPYMSNQIKPPDMSILKLAKNDTDFEDYELPFMAEAISITDFSQSQKAKKLWQSQGERAEDTENLGHKA